MYQILHFKYVKLLYKGFPGSSAGKESACNAGDSSSIPGSGRSPGEGIGDPLQYSGLKNSMDCVVHRVAKSWTQLSDFHFTSLQVTNNFNKAVKKKLQKPLQWLSMVLM